MRQGIQAASDGMGMTAPTITIDRNWRSVTVDGVEAYLSPREFEFLLTLSERTGYHAAWDIADQINMNRDDVKIYVMRLRKKLGYDAILSRHGFGYALARNRVAA